MSIQWPYYPPNEAPVHPLPYVTWTTTQTSIELSELQALKDELAKLKRRLTKLERKAK